MGQVVSGGLRLLSGNLFFSNLTHLFQKNKDSSLLNLTLESRVQIVDMPFTYMTRVASKGKGATLEEKLTFKKVPVHVHFLEVQRPMASRAVCPSVRSHPSILVPPCNIVCMYTPFCSPCA
jgi:hypothetical protein